MIAKKGNESTKCAWKHQLRFDAQFHFFFQKSVLSRILGNTVKYVCWFFSAPIDSVNALRKPFSNLHLCKCTLCAHIRRMRFQSIPHCGKKTYTFYSCAPLDLLPKKTSIEIASSWVQLCMIPNAKLDEMLLVLPTTKKQQKIQLMSFVLFYIIICMMKYGSIVLYSKAHSFWDIKFG